MVSMVLELIGGRKTLYAAAVGLVLGLFIGWWLLGVVLFPVDWKDAAPVDLHPTYRKEVVRAIADAYSVHGNADLTRAFLSERWEKNDLKKVIGELKAEATDDAAVQRLDALAQVLDISAAASVAGPTPAAPTSAEQPSLVGRLLPLCGVFLLIVAVVALAGLAVRILRNRRAVREEEAPFARMEEVLSPEMAVTVPGGALLGHFLTSYSLGNDHYEEAFTIETEDGYLGECGVAISESIGAGPPDKVTAFEVWLFDKNDVRTETKVLMSTHAFNDEALQNKLATRGDPVLAQPGEIITLETASLQVAARITEMEYGNGGMPEESYFSRITIELAASLKQGGGDTETTAFG